MRPDHHWNIVVRWTVATVAGIMIGILAILTPVTSLALRGTPTALVGMVGGVALGSGLGLAQWLILRQHLRGVTWWILASAIGGMIGAALGLVLADVVRPQLGSIVMDTVRQQANAPAILWSSALENGIAGAIIGICLGIAQWIILRGHIRSAGWWIVVSGLGWMAGLSVSAALIDIGGILVSLLLAGIIGGATTGWFLAAIIAGGADPARRA